MAGIAAQRMTGSPDLYDPVYRGGNASVNFLTCHDGFTLYDLYSYNVKSTMKQMAGTTPMVLTTTTAGTAAQKAKRTIRMSWHSASA